MEAEVEVEAEGKVKVEVKVEVEMERRTQLLVQVVAQVGIRRLVLLDELRPELRGAQRRAQ